MLGTKVWFYSQKTIDFFEIFISIKSKMYNYLLYFIYWFVNAAILLLATFVLPGNVVLGNWRFNAIESSIYAGFCATCFVWVLWDFAISKGVEFESKVVTFGYFWIANIFSFWLVSRFSQYAGLGISKFYWVLLLALIAHFAQRIAWSLVVKKK